jgi:hypothetical protein
MGKYFKSYIHLEQCRKWVEICSTHFFCGRGLWHMLSNRTNKQYTFSCQSQLGISFLQFTLVIKPGYPIFLEWMCLHTACYNSYSTHTRDCLFNNLTLRVNEAVYFWVDLDHRNKEDVQRATSISDLPGSGGCKPEHKDRHLPQIPCLTQCRKRRK